MARGRGADFDIPFEKRIASLKNLRAFFIIRKILITEGFDAIVLNTNLAAFLIRLALPKRLKKTTKVINFVHGYLFSDGKRGLKSAFFMMCERLVRGKCDVVITMNSDDHRMATELCLAREKVIASLGVGIKKRAVITREEKLRRELSVGHCRLITFVGELSKRKNQAFIIRSLPFIRKTVGDVRLCLVGDGGERSRLSALARELSVDGAVIFPGYRRDAMDFISACDLYVSSALCEGMPLNVIEAMSLGKTVLVSRIKGHTDLISDGDNGYLYSPDDCADFSNRVCRILLGERLDPERVAASVRGYDRDVAAARISKIIAEEIS